jgi:hypothetical protein
MIIIPARHPNLECGDDFSVQVVSAAATALAFERYSRVGFRVCSWSTGSCKLASHRKFRGLN